MGKLTSNFLGVPAMNLYRSCQLILSLVLGSSAFAQPAATLEPKTIAPTRNKTEEGRAAQPNTGAVAAPDRKTPSRNIGAPELKPYTASIASMFLIRERTRDPFGQNQDPEAKPEIKASAPLAVRRAAPEQATPFSDIVRLLDVTTIMPSEKRFLIGSRSFKVGDVMPLNFRNRAIQAVITDVTSRQISFRNQESGEIAVRKLDMLPAGMTAGSRGISAPGMMPDHSNAPIDLEAADPVSSSSKN